MPADDRTVARVLDHLYDIGIYPDWWKLPTRPPSEAAWAEIQEVIARRDPELPRRACCWGWKRRRPS